MALHLTYYPSGQIKSECNYLENQRIGSYASYHENGILMEKGNYINGKKHGNWEVFDE